MVWKWVRRIGVTAAALSVGTALAVQPLPESISTEVVSGGDKEFSGGSHYAPSLGAGVNFSETKTYSNCIVYKGLESEALSLTRDYKENRVTDRRDLNSQLDIDASISAKAHWGSVNASVAHFKNVKLNEESFYWLVDAKYEMTVEKIKTNTEDFDLTPRAKRMLKERGVRGFQSMCGTHFYTGRKLGARYTLLYDFKSKQDTVVSRLKAAAGYDSIGSLIKGNANFAKLLEQATKASILNVHSHIVGGDNKINDYARDPEKLDAELKLLRDKLYEDKKGVVIEWYLSSYDMFPEVLERKAEEKFEDVTDDFRNQALATYYGAYILNSANLEKIGSMIDRSTGVDPLLAFAEADIIKAREAARILQSQNDEITRLARACLNGANQCPTESVKLLKIELPKPTKDLSGLGNWSLSIQRAPGSTSHAQYINLVGTPEGNYRSRLFTTNSKLYQTNGGAIALAKDATGKYHSVQIGSFQSVLDPVTGKKRPSICIGDYAKVCRLRAVENQTRTMSDNYPLTTLQLSIFDQHGFVMDTLHFMVSE